LKLTAACSPLPLSCACFGFIENYASTAPPVAALAALTTYWAIYAFILSWRRAPGQFRATFQRYLPHIKMSWVVMAFFLYTPTSREVISLFSCQPVDSAGELPLEAANATDATAALTLPGSRWGVWTSDTNVECGSMHHLGLVIGGGVPGLLWVFGLPLALGLTLRRHNRMENQEQQLASERVSALVCHWLCSRACCACKCCCCCLHSQIQLL
jgi:hypothetical protein